MADPRIFMNADGNMSMNVDIDDDETSDEESSDDDVDQSATSWVLSGESVVVTKNEETNNGNISLTNAFHSPGKTIHKHTNASIDMGEESDDDSETEEEASVVATAVPVDEMEDDSDESSIDSQSASVYEVENNTGAASVDSSTNSSRNVGKLPFQESQQGSIQETLPQIKSSANGKAKNPSLSTTGKTPSPGLSLSATKKRKSTSPGLSLLKRRKLPLSNKRRLPTSKSPTMFKQSKSNDGEDDDEDTGSEQSSLHQSNTSQIDGKEQNGQSPSGQEGSVPDKITTNKAPKKLKKFKLSMARPTLLNPSIVSEKRILLHAGPADSLPTGWTVKHFKRTTGLKHTDRYWFSPLLKKKFRSLAQVGRFLEFLQQEQGDEAKAWELFRSSPPGPDEIRSRNRSSDDGKKKKGKAKSLGILGNTLQMANRSNTNTSAQKKKSSGTATQRSWKLPLISSPGLFVVPPPSILHRYKKQQELKQRRNTENNLDDSDQEGNETKFGPKIDLHGQGFVAPSLLFDHALDAAGYTKEKLAEAKHFGSSIIRSVDDLFDSNVSLEGIELVPKELWDRNVDECVVKSVVKERESGQSSGDTKIRRKARHQLLDNLQELIGKGTGSSGHSYQFEDMIPKSLTTEDRSQIDYRKDYLSKVRHREKLLKEYHAQKRSNEDKMDAYEDAMDEWSRAKESYERKKARREASETAAKQNMEQEASKEKTNGDIDKVNVELNGTSLSSQDKDATKKVVGNESTVTQQQQKELKDPGPAPIRPESAPLIEVPDVPIPNTLTSHQDLDSKNTKTDSEMDANYVNVDNPQLVAHLDPASFTKKGRYFGLLSNNLIDPQFVGPHAPGITGLNNVSGICLSSSPEKPSRAGNENASSKGGHPKTGSTKNTGKTSKSSQNSSKSKTKKNSNAGSILLGSSTNLKKIMEKGDSVAEAMRESIIKAAVYASRTGIHSGSFIGSTGESFPDISKAFSLHAKCKPCARCKNNKQGAYHCRLKRKHKDKDHDGGSSHKILEALFQADLGSLLPEKKVKKEPA